MRIVSGGGVPYDQRAAAARGEAVPGVDPNNLLGNLDNRDGIVGPTEMEFNVQLPTCSTMQADKSKAHKLHFDTTYSNIQVHHWIKIVLRLSRPDTIDPSKRRHFEISIDSPFHILSCRATQANTSLPAYSSPSPTTDSRLYQCGCPGAEPLRGHSPTSYAPVRGGFASQSSSRNSTDISGSTLLQPPPAAHLSGDSSPQAPNSPNAPRPMHIIRVPSFNPPAFDEEEPPPPLMTPPPEYDSIASPTSGLADYFARLSDAYSTDGDSLRGEMFEDEPEGMSTPTNRRSMVLDPPVTTGGASGSI